MRSLSRRLGTVLASVATAATLIVAPAAAQAQDLSSQLRTQVGSSQQQLQDAAWNTRNQIQQQTAVLNPQSSNAVLGAVDAAIEAAYPGMINQRMEAARPAPAAAPAPAPAPAFNTHPCPADAAVCVDIDNNKTWLQRNGQLVYGPAYHAPGKAGQETPRGTFWVNRKVLNDISYEFNNAPMPYAVYFTYNGHAFHEGNTYYESAGCVRLAPQDAKRFYEHLNVGDKVFIF